jgi:hypothetical protein
MIPSSVHGRASLGRRELLAFVLLAAAICVVGAVVLTCVAPARGEPANVLLTLQVERNGESVTLRGSTDFPDRTVVQLSVTNMDFADYGSVDGSAVVASGRYSGTLDIAALRSGDLLATATFAVGAPGQPSELVERFGLHGEGLRGPEVVHPWDGDDPFVQVSADVPPMGGPLRPSSRVAPGADIAADSLVLSLPRAGRPKKASGVSAAQDPPRDEDTSLSSSRPTAPRRAG